MIGFFNRGKLSIYFLIWIFYALWHFFSMYWLIELPVWMLLTDTFIQTALFALTGFLFWSVMYYGNYEKLSFFQQVINYASLSVLVLLLCPGLGYLLNYLILPDGAALQFIPTLPLRGLIAFLLCLVFIFAFRNIVTEPVEEQVVEQEAEEITDSENEKGEIEILERIVVRTGTKIEVIPVADILYLQSDGDYVHIITPKGKLLKEQTMKYFEQHLPVAQFARIHRSYIINIESISRVELHAKQNQLVIMKNGDKLKVSAAGYKMLRATLDL